MKAYLFAAAAGAAIFLATAASAGVVVAFGTTIDPASQPDVAPPVSDLNLAILVPYGHVSDGGWDPYGDQAGGYSTTDASHAWLSISDGGSATVAGLNGVLRLIWGSPNAGNEIDLYDGLTLVDTITSWPSSWANSGAPGYFTGIYGDFTSAVLKETAGGDFEVGFTTVPELSTWTMMGLGFAGLAFAAGRSRRAATSIA